MARVRPELAAVGTRVNLELTINHHYTTVLARTAKTAPLQPRAKDGLTPWQRQTTQYDAIVVGGGHNGLVNGAYLAKAGLKLARSSSAAPSSAARRSPRSCVPGFHFTTFSYALSLLRPDDHPGARPGQARLHAAADAVVVPPDGERRLPPARRGPTTRTSQEIMRHSPHDADAIDRYEHDMDRVCQAVKPLFDNAPPNIFGKDPEDQADIDVAARPPRRDRAEGHARHRPAAHRQRRPTCSTTTSRATSSRATIASSGIIGTKVGPMSQGSGLVLLFHIDGRARRPLRLVGVPQGRQRRLHPGAGPRGRRRSAPRSGSTPPVDVGDHARGPGRPASPSRTAPSSTRRSSSSALDPRRTFTRAGRAARAAQRPGREHRPVPVPGHVGEGQLRPRRAAACTRRSATAPTSTAASSTSARRWSTSSGRSTTRSTAGTASSPYIDGAIQSVVDPDMAPPGKHVMSCFVQYAPYHLKGSDWDTEREPFGDTVQAVLESLFPGFGDLVLHREVVTPLDIERVDRADRGQHLRRRVPRPADVLLPAGAGLEPVPHPDRRLLPVRLGHPPRRLRDGRARQARQPADPAGPQPLADVETARPPTGTCGRAGVRVVRPAAGDVGWLTSENGRPASVCAAGLPRRVIENGYAAASEGQVEPDRGRHQARAAATG